MGRTNGHRGGSKDTKGLTSKRRRKHNPASDPAPTADTHPPDNGPSSHKPRQPGLCWKTFTRHAKNNPRRCQPPPRNQHSPPNSDVANTKPRPKRVRPKPEPPTSGKTLQSEFNNVHKHILPPAVRLDHRLHHNLHPLRQRPNPQAPQTPSPTASETITTPLKERKHDGDPTTPRTPSTPQATTTTPQLHSPPWRATPPNLPLHSFPFHTTWETRPHDNAPFTQLQRSAIPTYVHYPTPTALHPSPAPLRGHAALKHMANITPFPLARAKPGFLQRTSVHVSKAHKLSTRHLNRTKTQRRNNFGDTTTCPIMNRAIRASRHAPTKWHGCHDVTYPLLKRNYPNLLKYDGKAGVYVRGDADGNIYVGMSTDVLARNQTHDRNIYNAAHGVKLNLKGVAVFAQAHHATMYHKMATCEKQPWFAVLAVLNTERLDPKAIEEYYSAHPHVTRDANITNAIHHFLRPIEAHFTNQMKSTVGHFNLYSGTWQPPVSFNKKTTPHNTQGQLKTRKLKRTAFSRAARRAQTSHLAHYRKPTRHQHPNANTHLPPPHSSMLNLPFPLVQPPHPNVHPHTAPPPNACTTCGSTAMCMCAINRSVPAHLYAQPYSAHQAPTANATAPPPQAPAPPHPHSSLVGHFLEKHFVFEPTDGTKLYSAYTRPLQGQNLQAQHGHAKPFPWESSLKDYAASDLEGMLDFITRENVGAYPANKPPTRTVAFNLSRQINRTLHPYNFEKLTPLHVSALDLTLTMDMAHPACDHTTTTLLKHALNLHNTDPDLPPDPTTTHPLASIDRALLNPKYRPRSIHRQGTQTYNFSSTHNKPHTSSTCGCHRYNSKHKHKFPSVDQNHHVATADPSLILSLTDFPLPLRQSLTAKLQLGPCARLDPQHDRDTLIKIYSNNVTNYLKSLYYQQGLNKDKWSHAYTVAVATTMVDTIFVTHTNKPPRVPTALAFTPQEICLLKHLQKDIIIAQLEKSHHNYSLMCRKTFCSFALDQLNQPHFAIIGALDSKETNDIVDKITTDIKKVPVFYKYKIENDKRAASKLKAVNLASYGLTGCPPAPKHPTRHPAHSAHTPPSIPPTHPQAHLLSPAGPAETLPPLATDQPASAQPLGGSFDPVLVIGDLAPDNTRPVHLQPLTPEQAAAQAQRAFAGYRLQYKPQLVDGKLKVKWRTITAMGHTIGSPRAKAINKTEPLLGTLFDTVHRNLYRKPPRHLVKSYSSADLDRLRALERSTWIAPSSREAAATMRKVNRTLKFLQNNPYEAHTFASTAHSPSLESWDFSNMYNLTSTSDIVKMHATMTKEIKKLMRGVKATHTHVRMAVDPDTADYTVSWSPPLAQLPQATQDSIRENHESVFSLDAYHNHYVDTIQSAYSKFNGVLRHQVSGIPQGIEPGVYIANSLCAFYEYEFTMQCIKNKDFYALEQLQFALRYIDDIICPLSTCFEQFKYKETDYEIKEGPNAGKKAGGIYPHGTPAGTALTLNCEGATHTRKLDHPPNSLSFLDHLYTIVNGVIHITQFDKRILSKFDYTPLSRFTPQESLIWRQAKSGALMSELDRHYFASSKYENFVDIAAKTTLELYYRAYPWHELTTVLTTFLRKRHLTFPPQRAREAHSTYNDIMNRTNTLAVTGLPLFLDRNARLGFPNPPHMPAQPPPTRHKNRKQFRAPHPPL